MFSLIVRVISVCIIGGFFATIVFTSFFSQKNNTDILDIQDIFVSNQIEKISTGSAIYKKDISTFDSFFSNQKDVSFRSESGSITVDISLSGSYLSSFRDLGKKYIFLGKGFRVEQKGIGEIFFDTQSVPWKVLIFPLNTSLELSLVSEPWISQETYTHIFLTPHMYIEFDPLRGTSLKNADSLRVKTIFHMWYFWNPISEIYEDIYFQNYQTTLTTFLKESFSLISKRDMELQKQLLLLKQQKVNKILGTKTIERYAVLFVNPEKKKAFYKNIILEGFLDILESEVYDATKVEKVRKDIKALRLLSEDSYREILKIQEQILTSLYASSNIRDTPLAFSFASLFYPELTQEKTYFLLSAHALFSLYDLRNEFSGESIKIFLQSFWTFIVSEDLSPERKSLRYEYFLYFLKNQIFTLLREDSITWKISATTDVLKNYIDISSLRDSSSLTSRITSLYIYDEILKEIDISLRKKYFLPERTQQDILQLGSVKMNMKEGSLLRIQIERIFGIYYELSKFLDTEDTRYIDISKDIETSQKHIKEYFSALENYQAYISQYDIAKKDLLTIDLSSQIDETLLSEEEIRKYLQTFEGIDDISSVKVQVKEEYYHLENVFISGRVFDFDLYPYSSYYALRNIVIDGNLFLYSYNIPLEEENINIESEEKKPQARFFLDTFFQNSMTEVEEYVEQDQQLLEDKTEIIFKREILLWKKWEFTKISKIFPVKYENIRIEKTQTGYNTFLDNVVFPLFWENAGYIASLNSTYILSSIDHYFSNISLTISSESDGEMLFSGVPVHLPKIPLLNFETIIGEMGNQIPFSQQLYSILEKKYSLENFTIQYTSYNKKMTFKFDSQDKNYIISLAGNMVDKISIDATSILSEPVDIKNISSYLR